MQRIWETRFLPVDLLGPFLPVFGAEDPAAVIFGFDHEDAVQGYDDVVDLCGALAVWAREVEVVKALVVVGIETTENQADLAFTPPTSDQWGFDKRGKQNQQQQADHVGQVGL